jgi:hypothetical protein
MPPAAAAFVASSPKLERLTGLVCMFSPVTPVCAGITMAGFGLFSDRGFAIAGPCEALGGRTFEGFVAAGLGLACLDVL